MPELTVISLGWGVQSWTLAAMSALGALPKVDAAIHADTTHERSQTYAFAAEWTPWLEAHGVPVVTVTSPATKHLNDPNVTNILIPAYTLARKGAAITSGQGLDVAGGLESVEQTEGQLRRQCTNRWKIEPLRRWVSGELTRRGLAKQPGIVEQWLGISRDEWQRARTSDVAYTTYRYPLLDLKMTRVDCVAWLQAHDLPVPPKSACVFCPYHNARAWGELKRQAGPDWAHALEIDNVIRDARPPYPLFVHPKRVPLAEAVVIPEDQGLVQGGLFPVEDDDAPCDSGYCFL